MTRAFAWVFLSTLSASVPLTAQAPAHLTQGDSAVLRTAVLQILLDSVGPEQVPPRIWIRPYTERDPATDERHSVAPTDSEWRAIEEAFPMAVFTEDWESVVLCSPGVRLRLPGSGCPIRDHGVIVEFMRLALDADSVQTGGRLTQTAETDSGYLSWMGGLGVVFRRVEGAWRLVGVRWRSVT